MGYRHGGKNKEVKVKSFMKKPFRHCWVIKVVT